MSIPLLQERQLPDFKTLSINDFEPALDALTSEFYAQQANVCRQDSHDWADSIAPLSDLSRRIDHVWALLSHLKAVDDSEELREIFKRLSEKMTAFNSDISQNEDLYKVYLKVCESASALDLAQNKVLEKTLRGTRLNGVALPEREQNEFKALSQKLSKLSNQFSENVLDSTQAWSCLIDDANELAGVPDNVLLRLQERAKDKGYDQGYLLGLDLTLYLPVMQYCENRDLRASLYRAFITRASNLAPHKAEHANELVMLDIMKARKSKSELLELPSYAALSVLPKMAESPEQVIEFLTGLLEKAKPIAESEFADLSHYAQQKFEIEQLEAWDVPFVQETLRKERFDIDQEALRQYFPLPVVLEGLFSILKRLFGIDLVQRSDVSTPVADAQCYEVQKEGAAIAYIYMDLYSREGKRGGAWVAPCHKLTQADDHSLLPVAFLVCNFAQPSNGKPSLLTHSDVVTLFHETGHALHHCLTKVSYPEVSGISGVPWDAVELPSQFLENWCWQPESLAVLSRHVDTGETLPSSLVEKLTQAKNFLGGMMTVRQVEFGLFDFLLHHRFDENVDIQALLEEVQSNVSVVPVPEFARFANAFTHIFAGGYAAGYYSYKWAEVLSADAFSAFEEEGVFNATTGQRFQEEILERGGAGDVNEMFVAFRGRMPSSKALLQQIGS